MAHKNWTLEQWDEVMWSDEMWVNPGTHRRVRVIRKIGEEELYHSDCVEGREQRKIGWMFWGEVSGKYSKGPYLFWNKKKCGNIGSKTYHEYTVPLIYEYIEQHTDIYLMQDNCSGHAAKATLEHMASIRIVPMYWPSCSPDLNPIETVWNVMKEYIHLHYSKSHCSHKKLKEQALEAWHAVPDSKIRELVHSMPECCAAVIEAKGWHTKF